MQPLMDVVSGIKVAAQHALEILADQPFDDFPRAGVMVLVIAYRWRTHTPDISVETIFSPARLIGLHCWTRTDGGLEIVEHGLGMGNEAVKHLHHLSNAHLKAVQRTQEVPDLPNGQTHHRAQGGNQTGQSNPNAPLTQHICAQIHGRLMPFLTLRTPAFENPMMDDLHRRWRRKIDHLSHPRQADAAQPQVTIGAGHDAMLRDLCRHRTRTPVIVLRVTLLARLLFFRFWLFHVRFDKLRGRHLLLFQLLDAGQSQAQVFLHLAQLSQCLAEGFSQRLVFRSKVSDFFLLCHGLSLSERSSLNTFVSLSPACLPAIFSYTLRARYLLTLSKLSGL